MDVDEIVARGFNEATVRRVALLVDRAEFKRRQNPPGIKITGACIRAGPADAHHQAGIAGPL